MRRLLITTLVLSAAQFVQAQTQVQIEKAQVAIPFGSVTGTLVLAGDMLVFVDDGSPEASFAVPRSDILDVRTEGEIIAVDVRQPIRDRTGERNKLSFRMMQAGAASILPGWWRQKPGLTADGTTAARTASSASAASASAATSSAGVTLPVMHDHRIGGCTGRLIIGNDRINFESVSEVSHSRQWTVGDVKEIKHKNPYHLEIVDFQDGEYNFDLQGRSLDAGDYQKLVDRIATARAKQ